MLSQAIQGLENRYILALGVSTSKVDKNLAVSWGRKLEIWQKYTILQEELMRLSGVRAYFFLQPNQYLKGAKPLSKEEWSIAINPDRVYTGNTEMRLLRSAGQDMQADGLPVYDLTGIFRGTAETVYEDACCHLNELGNQIMAKENLEAIRLEVVAKRTDIGEPALIGAMQDSGMVGSHCKRNSMLSHDGFKQFGVSTHRTRSG